LENEGGLGSKKSHFEMTLHKYDIMVAGGISFDNIITNFDIAIFKDMGWYIVDES
jgi:hypothetical protein